MNDLWKYFNVLTDILTFFERYDVRCPKNGIHTYDLTSAIPICSKCGYNKIEMNSNLIDNIPSPGSMLDKYYNKFKYTKEIYNLKKNAEFIGILKKN